MIASLLEQLVALVPGDQHGEQQHRRRQGDRQVEADFELQALRRMRFLASPSGARRRCDMLRVGEYLVVLQPNADQPESFVQSTLSVPLAAAIDGHQTRHRTAAAPPHRQPERCRTAC